MGHYTSWTFSSNKLSIILTSMSKEKKGNGKLGGIRIRFFFKSKVGSGNSFVLEGRIQIRVKTTRIRNPGLNGLVNHFPKEA